MPEHGETPGGQHTDHTPHGQHADHSELARLHTVGWFVGHAIRTGHDHGLTRLQALLDGLGQGLEERGAHGDRN